MKLRPTPSLVVAVLALVVALAGTSYAAATIGSAQIKNNSVKGKDIKDGSLTGKDVKDGSLAGPDVADGSLTGADVQDGSLSAADLAPRGCPASTVSVLGSCIDRVSNGSQTTFAAALAACDARGARLMDYQEYRVLVTKIGTGQWADGNPSMYEAIAVPEESGAAFVPQGISYGGSIFTPATGSNLFFRCVSAPV
jgi:hypothetical protein